MTISAKIIADSMCHLTKKRITTFELEYPRFIHAELMTHRLFSRNAASSRAIPVAKAIELIRADTARPTHWGKNQPGMSAKEECDALVPLPASNINGTNSVGVPREFAWDKARDNAIVVAEAFNEAGYHKQIVNRLLEPFTHIKVVLTATEFDNWFWLRKHPDAQPEIQRLAEEMYEARKKSIPYQLVKGEWHVPYYQEGFWMPANHQFDDWSATEDRFGVTLEDALAVSASCCAQVSYRRLDDSIEKARDIFKRLVESKPVHASPFEHQATVIDWSLDADGTFVHKWDRGITHQDRFNDPWSGNFQGWIQHRQLIPENACWAYKDA